MQAVRSKEEKEILEHFAGVVSVIPPSPPPLDHITTCPLAPTVYDDEQTYLQRGVPQLY